MTLFVKLMGTVRLVQDGKLLDVGGPKQQTILAILALSPGHRVSTDRLIDLVWDAAPPPTARRTVQSYVASLRRAMGAGSFLEPSQSGYLLNLGRECVDLLSFEDDATALLNDAGLDPDHKARLLTDLLEIWESPLDDLRGAQRLADLMAPFEELRLQLVEDLASAQIAGSRSGDAVKMLEGLVREHPTRENLWHELARGQHRLGRRDSALNAIQRAREQLREHLGINPSTLLTALEQDLLSDDSATLADPDGVESGPDNRDGPSGTETGYLPQPLSSFVGRTDELREVAQLVSRSRLATLRGLGGIGKTSLALQVAKECRSGFADGVWFIDLAYIATEATMPERLLAALGQQTRAEIAPLNQLLIHLRPLQALLVIDNCEQQVDEIGELVEQIVHAAPNVHILATSRHSLAVAGEAVWQVDALDVSSAIELFADRARLVRPDFELNDTNRAVVELICEKLDGIPLAIELAAPRLSALSLDQVLSHLDDRFELLQTQAPRPGADERTLRSALDWSYELLDQHDQTLLRRLSVFPAMFTLHAAQKICANDERTMELVKSMSLLVHASLVVFDANDADPRYRLLETVREYAAEKLSAAERDEITTRHTAHYSQIAARVAVLHATDHIGALHAVDQDLDNFRSAIANAFARQDHQLGLSIARYLRMYFFSRQLDREYLRWLQVGIEHVDPESDEGLVAVANALVAAFKLSDAELAERLATQVERGIDVAQDPAVRARLGSSLGAHFVNIDPRRADELLAAATALAKTVDPIETIACIHNRLATAWRTGDLPGAPAMRADLVSLPQGELVRRTDALVKIHVAACAGKWQDVVDATFEQVPVSEQEQSYMFEFRAEALGALGRVDESIETLDQLDAHLPCGDPSQSLRQTIRATSELRRDGAAAAKALLAESSASFTREADRVQGLWLASLAGVATQQLGEADTAAQLFGYANVIAGEFNITPRASERPLIQHATEHCREDLGIERFDELATRGATSSWTSLVELLHAT